MTYHNLTHIEVLWLNCTDDRPVGIVRGYDPIEGRWKFYIGTGFGHSEEGDICRIISMGQKFSSLEVLAEFGRCEND